MLRQMIGALAAAALMVAFATSASALDARLEPVVEGVNAPMEVVPFPDGTGRLAVVEQRGTIRIIEDGELRSEPFLNIENKVHPDLWHFFDERGLLGLAFHPNYRQNGKFYIYYSARVRGEASRFPRQFWWSNTNIVAEYKVSGDNPNKANDKSERILMETDWPQRNHQGGWMAFGPDDGYLYVSHGDGGYADDYGIGHTKGIGNAQDLSDPHGKMMRIDVDTMDPGRQYGIPSDNPFVNDMNALDEIYAYGLRNAWRCSFDKGGNHDLICGDVQQNSWEEVTLVDKGDNLGWRRMEGRHCFDYMNPNDHPANCDTSGLRMPVIEYANCTANPEGNGGCLGISVIGGYVYRGSHSAWDGKYFFGDWALNGEGVLYAADMTGSEWSMEPVNVVNQDMSGTWILGFGQDLDGEVYVMVTPTLGPVGWNDTVYKLTPP